MTIFILGQKVLFSQLNVMNIEQITANSGYQTTGVGSFGSINVDALIAIPGLTVSGVSSLGSILVNSGTLLAVAPSPPIANEVYRESIIRGWVRFNGTTVASFGDVGSSSTGIADSYNVSGVHDAGTGDYDIFWDTDFANANYATCALGGSQIDTTVSHASPTTSQVNIRGATASTGVAFDMGESSVIAIGDQ